MPQGVSRLPAPSDLISGSLIGKKRHTIPHIAKSICGPKLVKLNFQHVRRNV